MIRKEQQYNKDNFINQINANNYQPLDEKRIKSVQTSIESEYTRKDDHEEQTLKLPVKFHKFREDARKHHREITQQHHDMMKMSQSITKSVFNNNDRFKIPLGGKSNKNKDINSNDNNNGDAKETPNITLKFDIPINASILKNTKIEIKNVYNIFPYKKMSIEIEPNSDLNPAYEFFLFRQDISKASELQTSLVQIEDGGLTSDLRQEISTLTYYLSYFDYIHFVKYLIVSNTPKEKTGDKQDKVELVEGTRFPKEIIELAKISCKFEASSDEEEEFNKEEIIVDSTTSFHRVFECDETELSKPFDSIYFPDLADYENYKRLRETDFKSLNIDDEYNEHNTDVRNIISSEKIYLINIIEEMQLSIELLKTNKEPYLMKSLHQMVKKKIFEFLHLVCGYTKSTILIRYNIEDYFTKIYEFLYKSILYGKEYKNLDPKTLKKYEVLEIWYFLPDKIYGYGKDEIHNALYDLIRATIDFEKQIKKMEQIENLKIKNYDRKYLKETE